MKQFENIFIKKILEIKKTPVASSEYGADVIPVLSFYKELKTYEERKAFQDALESLLNSTNPDERSFAVKICLGFFVFRSAF